MPLYRATSASDPQTLIERLPIELLERIFLFTSVRDILQLSVVNHAFHRIVGASPSIQYEIDLFGAGLQRNPKTKTPLADCRAALEKYCRGRETFDAVEEWSEDFEPSQFLSVDAVGGTLGILWEHSAKFFTLGSISRGIPKRRWDISFKHLRAQEFAFYPQADVLAIIAGVGPTLMINLTTLSDGEPHPSARVKVLSYAFAHTDFLEASITGSRLAVLRGDLWTLTAQVVVWDWITGQIVLELGGKRYRSAIFHGDCWLSVVVDWFEPDTSLSLVFLNTEQATTGDLEPAETVFCFHPYEHLHVEPVIDRGGYKPSPEEDSLAPFYQDASQRMLAVKVYGDLRISIFVVKIEVLLKLARELGEAYLEWEEWRTHMVQIPSGNKSDHWISGSRLLCLRQAGRPDGRAGVKVYDFSPRASARYMETVADDYGGFVRRMRPSVEERPLPWDAFEVQFSTGGHDNIAHFTGQDSDEGPLAGTLHLWDF